MGQTLGQAFAQQGYPSRNITFIVPFTPADRPTFWRAFSASAFRMS